MTDLHIIAWAVVRIALAWMFLVPLPGLLKDWQGTVNLSALLCKWNPRVLAIISVLIMLFGALSVLIGIFPRVGALGLCLYSLCGYRVHRQLARQAKAMANKDNQPLVTLAQVGHVTSAQKNIVIAALAFFMVLQGVGPYMLINLF